MSVGFLSFPSPVHSSSWSVSFFALSVQGGPGIQTFFQSGIPIEDLERVVEDAFDLGHEVRLIPRTRPP